MMRLPRATSVSTWQTSRAVKGEVVLKVPFLRVSIAVLMRVAECGIADSGPWPGKPEVFQMEMKVLSSIKEYQPVCPRSQKAFGCPSGCCHAVPGLMT
jgi:hypothetical protein